MFEQLFSAGMGLLGKAAAPAGPSISSANGGTANVGIDHSGWTVATSGSRAAATAGAHVAPGSVAMPTDPAITGAILPAMPVGAGTSIPGIYVIGALGLLAFAIVKRK